MNSSKLNLFVLPALAAVAATVGCAGPDMTMRNPIIAGVLDQNHIVKPHGYAESQSGLPPGSMNDEAVIDTLDKNQICVNVSLHELAALDLTQGEIKIESDTGSLLQPQLNAEAPTSQTFQGLVPHTEQTGTRLVCNYQNGQSVCETQPVYSTTMIPGPVDVFNTRGRLCAPNQNIVTPQTKKMSLKITTPIAKRSAWGFGHANKSVTFRWAFQ
jgi:hypothetical protein